MPEAIKGKISAGDDPIYFAVPGAKKYFNRFYRNSALSFVNVSITGRSCALNCAHCGATLLRDMLQLNSPEQMKRLIDRLLEKNCRGILVSGGADHQGRVPLLPFCEAISYGVSRGLKIIAHTGLIDRETALQLKNAGVEQVLMDIIGDEQTITRVYHLDVKPDDYLRAMLTCREAGLKIAPHVVIGLHFGHILGEIRAIKMIKEVNPEILVLVILTPLKGTAMAGVSPTSVQDAAMVMSKTMEYLPDIPVNLGCARPAGRFKRDVEKIAVDYHFNAIAYPDESTVYYALEQGRRPVFIEECCSLQTGENR